MRISFISYIPKLGQSDRQIANRKKSICEHRRCLLRRPSKTTKETIKGHVNL